MTLVELLVVVGIIGIIIGISVPGLAGYAKHLRLKTATRQAAGLISLARSTAITTHEDHAVVIDPEEREIRVVTVSSGDALEQRLRLPTFVTVELQVGGEPAIESQFVFRPTGSLTGRSVSVVLADQERQQTITVVGATGAVSVQ
jgi:Tfp pilus assembly protein FimT